MDAQHDPAVSHPIHTPSEGRRKQRAGRAAIIIIVGLAVVAFAAYLVIAGFVAWHA